MRRCTLSRLAAALIILGVFTCGAVAAADKPFRVAVMRFQQETCTFCPGGDAATEDWTRLGPLLAGEALLDSGSDIRGFVQQVRDYGDMDLLPLTSPGRLYGGSSRSWSTRESFETFVGRMIEELEAAMPVDAAYLALHGALAVRGVPRPEAEIARRFRQVLGPGAPIAATFDLHGNEDEAFLRWADFSFVSKRYPHYDMRRQGQRAARALHLALKGGYRSTTATRKPGIITPTVVQWTGAAPSSAIMERARRWEDREPGAFVSVFYGFPWADVPDAGATIQVMTNNDQDLADRIADDMNGYFRRVREAFANIDLPDPATAAQQVAAAVASGQTPVAVGDHYDRPGDATHVLRAFEAAGIGKAVYAAITSPATLERLAAAGAAVGDAFDDTIGGFTPSGGAPYRIRGTIAYAGPWAGYPMAVAVAFGAGNLVFLAPAYTQVRHPETLRVGDIDPNDYEVFVVKSRVHFRRGFDETGFARTILLVEPDQPFVGTTRLEALPYENLDLERLYPYGDPSDY